MERKLAAKLAKIMGEVNNVEKNGENKFHGYKYAMEQDMLVAVRKKLSEANIFVTTSVRSVEIRETPKEGFLTTIITDHLFTDGETGETLTAASAGQGTDKGDKGVYKAITGATKYFISKNFLIPTGDDPESFDEKRESAGRAPKQAVRAQPVQTPPQLQNAVPMPLKPAENKSYPPNPWVGKLINITAPEKGIYNGKEWSRWDIETTEFNLSTFDRGVAEVAVNAITDHKTVEMVWKVSVSKKTGVEKLTAEGMTIIN